eukprot:TRINITY_DN14921_c0_g1_i2.p2 TRINITY_DN14921_c0_g1~~TRINITY_DN14921_c0_g1_i2.p2  ORF type:complete len:102 (+),score=22.40 TRINITY_DN14921_c0_g1_i2:66-371(+)
MCIRDRNKAEEYLLSISHRYDTLKANANEKNEAKFSIGEVIVTINGLDKIADELERNTDPSTLTDLIWLVGKLIHEQQLSLIHICRCRRYAVCRSRWSPYH